MSRLDEVLPRRIDGRLLAIASVLTLIGIAMVVSTTSDTVRGGLGGKQALFAALGVVFAFAFLLVDYRILLQYSPGLYAVSLFFLIWLPILGRRIAGAKSWIKIGAFQFQPSEFVRLSLALLLAWVLENDDRAFLRRRSIVLLTAAVGLPVLLILAGTLVVGGSWFFLKDYQKDRIRTFLDPNLAARGAGYQVRQARIAVGSGGIFGKGWKKGTQSRLGFLPVRHTDFVFAALAEEWGFAGVAAVVALYGLLLGRAFNVARNARDRGGSMLVLLLALNIGVQAAVNVAMNIGLLPTTGITLPFLSYGGSSLLASWGMVGLMLSVAYRRYVNV
ncbi:MAG TPA: FtsW/RodA/SpoVE family cell cycle protein [Thermoanaerobaculia bacterium]|nr:FtsW/RodA/SpoVE family cell cycle protein [Thermoanaerobaculia bacterium]